MPGGSGRPVGVRWVPQASMAWPTKQERLLVERPGIRRNALWILPAPAMCPGMHCSYLEGRPKHPNRAPASPVEWRGIETMTLTGSSGPGSPMAPRGCRTFPAFSIRVSFSCFLFRNGSFSPQLSRTNNSSLYTCIFQFLHGRE